MQECKSDLIYNSVLSDLECKLLSCERIDDHTPNHLNAASIRFGKVFSMRPDEFRTKSDFLFRLQTVRRPFDATRSAHSAWSHY